MRDEGCGLTGREPQFVESVNREVATIMRALAPMGGTKEQSDACIALGRLAAWAEAGLNRSLRIVHTGPDKVMSGGADG